MQTAIFITEFRLFYLIKPDFLGDCRSLQPQIITSGKRFLFCECGFFPDCVGWRPELLELDFADVDEIGDLEKGVDVDAVFAAYFADSGVAESEWNGETADHEDHKIVVFDHIAQPVAWKI